MADKPETTATEPSTDGLAKRTKQRRKSRKSTRAATAKAGARISADQLPRKSLEQALRVARALRDVHAGGPTKWPQIAEAMGISAGAQVNKYFLWSAQAYGLVEREDDSYSLSEIGRKILAPTKPNEDKEAQVRALMTPILFSRFLTDYNGSPFPAEEHIGNVLEVRYGVPRERVEEAKVLLKDNGLFTGILRQADDGMIVRLDPSTTGVPAPAEHVSPPEITDGVVTAAPAGQTADTMCFVVTPIGEDDSDQRRHANMILKNVIEPVVQELGLKAVRADQIDRAGIITKQIFPVSGSR